MSTTPVCKELTKTMFELSTGGEALGRDWAVTPKEFSHRRFPGWQFQPGYLLAGMIWILKTPEEPSPSRTSGLVQKVQWEIVILSAKWAPPSNWFYKWGWNPGGFVDLMRQVGNGCLVPKVNRCLTSTEIQGFMKKVLFGSGCLRPTTPEPCITVDRGIKSKQRKQKITQIYQALFLCKHGGGAGRRGGAYLF